MAEERELCTLITGASSGLGRALALRLSGRCRLVLNGRNAQRLEETRASCLNPALHITWPYDLCDVEHLAESLRILIAEKGLAVECFIHAAGLLKILPARSVNCRVFNEILNTNLVSAAEIVSLLVKKRVNRQQLRNVLFISSIASKFGAPGFSMYSSSKSALDGMMRGLAVELAPNVRVNSILPGGFRTPMTDELLADEAVLAKFVHDYPLGIGHVEDIVAAAEFLVSESSRWITGQQIVVDGGRSVNISV